MEEQESEEAEAEAEEEDDAGIASRSGTIGNLISTLEWQMKEVEAGAMTFPQQREV